MDVFHVGASAPKAPESRGVERAETRATGRSVPPSSADEIATSPDAAVVARHVDKLAAQSAVREDVITSVSELMGRGLFDTPDAARRAAQGILDS